MSKIVVLNSGGFDSVTLMNYLHILEGENDIHSLHFLYGARNEKQQLECVEKVCEKCNAVNKVIQLPVIDWTSSDFFKEGYEYETQYLEYRNLIFLSYALSYAQAIGADKIYMAVLKGGGYPDTSEVFFRGINSFSVPQTNIEVVTPFSDIECKEDLLQYAILCGMKPSDYFSCDNPKENGERCGECLDCIALNHIEETLTVNHPFKALYQSGFNYDDTTFHKLLREVPKDREVRALINNDCQLRCSHCFYGFSVMKRESVDVDTYYKALKELVLEHGFTNIHFSGKEPLYDGTILEYARRIKKDNLPCTFNVVTNGINVPKYVAELKSYGMNKVFLSVDSVRNTNGVRTLGDKVTWDAIFACKEVEMPVEVFIDLHKNNYDCILAILKRLHSNGIKEFYIRTIRSIGKAKNSTNTLDGSNLYEVFRQVELFCSMISDCQVQFCISSEYVPTVLGNKEFKEVIDVLDSCYTNMWNSNFYFSLERYCNRYQDITLTPDGYVLGCASEVSRPDYDVHSAGNICDDTIDNILKRGIELRCSCANKFTCDNYSCMVNKF